jgi:hypothetical protein
MNAKTHVNQCPHCHWKGLIIPKLAIGCPEHGVWWQEPVPRKPAPEKEKVAPKKRRDRAARREEGKRHSKK